MSAKLNAEELAKRHIPDWSENDFTNKQRGFVMCVERVAQPIADERDELIEALKKLTEHAAQFPGRPRQYAMARARTILAKYPEP